MKEKFQKLNNSPEFYLLSLIFAGLCGYIYIGTMNSISTLQAMIHPMVFLIISETCSYVWLFYALYINIKKKKISKKGLFNCFVLTPIILYSVIGQLGNSEALKVLLGTSASQIYYIIFICTYCFSLYLLLKKQKQK